MPEQYPCSGMMSKHANSSPRKGGVFTKALLAVFKKTNDVIEKIEIVVGCFTLVLFIVMTAWQVAARFTGWVSYFTQELATTAFVWTAFMGAPVMLRRYEHYRFTGVAERLRGKAFWVNEFVSLCVLLVCNVLMLVHGIELSKMFYTWRFGSMFTVSKIWLWICLPISGGTGVLYVIEHFLKFLDDPSTRKVVSEADKLLEEN